MQRDQIVPIGPASIVTENERLASQASRAADIVLRKRRYQKHKQRKIKTGTTRRVDKSSSPNDLDSMIKKTISVYVEKADRTLQLLTNLKQFVEEVMQSNDGKAIKATCIVHRLVQCIRTHGPALVTVLAKVNLTEKCRMVFLGTLVLLEEGDCETNASLGLVRRFGQLGAARFADIMLQLCRIASVRTVFALLFSQNLRSSAIGNKTLSWIAPKSFSISMQEMEAQLQQVDVDLQKCDHKMDEIPTSPYLDLGIELRNVTSFLQDFVDRVATSINLAKMQAVAAIQQLKQIQNWSTARIYDIVAGKTMGRWKSIVGSMDELYARFEAILTQGRQYGLSLCDVHNHLQLVTLDLSNLRGGLEQSLMANWWFRRWVDANHHDLTRGIIALKAAQPIHMASILHLPDTLERIIPVVADLRSLKESFDLTLHDVEEQGIQKFSSLVWETIECVIENSDESTNASQTIIV